MAMERIIDQQLIQDFLNDCKLRHMSEYSIPGYKSSLNLFQRFISDKGHDLLKIDRKILQDYIEYLQKKGINYKTMKNRFSTYNSFYDYCVYENLIENNIIQSFMKRYLSKYKEDNGEQRRLISVEEMARFIHLIPDLRDKTIALLFAKTGIRRRELVAIDVDDIKWENMSIKLKPTKKRSNLIVYFDYETGMMLKRWLKKRELLADPDNQALFVSYINKRKRLNRNGVGYTFVKWAEIAGLHNSTSEKLSDKFTCHCCRHWYTTHLRRAGMSREFITEVRGDKGTSAMDIYNHVDHEELKRTYLSCIPQLGID